MDIDAYLARIGADRPAAPTVEALRDLQRAHLYTVPFETVDLHSEVPIVLEAEALFAKIVTRRRGGFCYELNGLFATLLRGLGYRVDLLSASVPDNDGHLGIPFDHLCLLVHLDRPWIADVGFGAHALLPLAADEVGPQADPAGAYAVERWAHGDLAVYEDDRLVYVAEARPRQLAEFEVGVWWQVSHPTSGFRRGPTCSRFTPDGRITLAGNRLIRTVDGVRHEQTLTTDDDIRAAYRHHFGIDLDRLPTIPPR